jgi:SNF2 family DNA or RNA helicase
MPLAVPPVEAPAVSRAYQAEMTLMDNAAARSGDLDTEVAKWEHLSQLRVSKIMGNPTQRLSALNSDAQIYLINLENVAWLCELSPKLVFTNLVIDESSRFKDPSTKRFKALKKHLKGFSRRLILTGTPTPQGMADLWSQVGILDLGQRLETSLTRFRDKYMQPDQMVRSSEVTMSMQQLQHGLR